MPLCNAAAKETRPPGLSRLVAQSSPDSVAAAARRRAKSCPTKPAVCTTCALLEYRPSDARVGTR